MPEPERPVRSARLSGAIAAIDAANAADPTRIVIDGVELPKELAHADVVERWVSTLDPSADELQILAARAHHLRRWVVPRTDYPEGRSGYLRWRADHKKRQAAEVGEILAANGYEPAEIDRVATIVAKRGLGTDPQVQVHEDALCLAFIELQFDELAQQLGDDHMVEVVRKTIRKMSPSGIAAASSIDLTEHGRSILAAAAAS